MNKNKIILVAAATALCIAAPFEPASAQTTFRACRVPTVGAIYMIGVTGTPNACLDPSHVEFQWTEGGAPGPNSVTSATIVDGTIATADVANGAITQAKLDAAVSFPPGANSVTSASIVDGTIAAADHATGSVTTTQILDATIASADIAANAVTTSAILNGTIVAADLATGAVGSAQLAAGLFQHASVSGTGTVFASSGGITGSLFSTGVYRLTFTQTLGGQGNCSLHATPADGLHLIQTIHGSRLGLGNNVLQINLANSSGTLINGGFEVFVVCL